MIFYLVEDRFRYVILSIGCLCLTSISSNMLAFNIAQVCMGSNDTNHVEDKIDLQFGIADGPLDYTPYEISLINWAVAVGTAFAAVPFSESYVRFGAKWPFFTAGMLSVFATLLMPLAAEMNIYALMAFRFLQGVSYAADFAAVGALCSSWASLKQNGLFLGVLTSYSPLSSGLTNWIGGMICNSRFGWPMIFYVHAAFGFIVFTLWFILYCDKPHESEKVTVVELEKIQRDKNSAQINGGTSIPYRTLISDLIIISIWMSAFAEIFSTNFLAVYSPYYIRNVLKYSAEKTGNYSAISRIVQIPVRLICGELSDRINSLEGVGKATALVNGSKLNLIVDSGPLIEYPAYSSSLARKFISEDLKLIIFNTITVAGAGLVYACIGFVPEDYPILAVLCFTMVNVVTGAASGGFYKSAVLYARQYSHFIIATCQLLKCAALFIGPAMVAIFVRDQTSQVQWRTIFVMSAIAMFFASAVFCKFSSAQPAPYTQDGYNAPKKSSKVGAMEEGYPKKF